MYPEAKYKKLCNESPPSGYFSYERVDSTMLSLENNHMSWDNSTMSDRRCQNQTTQPVSPSTLPNESSLGSWNIPYSRSPLPDLSELPIWDIWGDQCLSLVSPMKSIGYSSGDSLDPCFCSHCIQKGNFSLDFPSSQFYFGGNIPDTDKAYEELRKHFDSNGLDRSTEIQFSPDEFSTSTPSVSRKVLGELENASLQYFVPSEAYDVNNNITYGTEVEQVPVRVQPKKNRGKSKEKEIAVDVSTFFEISNGFLTVTLNSTVLRILL